MSSKRRGSVSAATPPKRRRPGFRVARSTTSSSIPPPLPSTHIFVTIDHAEQPRSSLRAHSRVFNNEPEQAASPSENTDGNDCSGGGPAPALTSVGDGVGQVIEIDSVPDSKRERRTKNVVRRCLALSLLCLIHSVSIA